MNTYIATKLLPDLLEIANLLYLPLQATSSQSDDRSSQLDTRRTISDWIWKISDECLSMDPLPTDLSPTIVPLYAAPLAAFAYPEIGGKDIEGDEKEAEEMIEVDQHILLAAVRFFDTLAAVRTEWLERLLDLTPRSSLDASPKMVVDTLLDFLELAKVSDIWTTVGDPPHEGGDDGGNMDPEKLMGQAKAVIMKAVVEIPAEVDMTGEAYKPFWDRMKGWMRAVVEEAEVRADLVSCGLLCYGNQARSGMSAVA